MSFQTILMAALLAAMMLMLARRRPIGQAQTNEETTGPHPSVGARWPRADPTPMRRLLRATPAVMSHGGGAAPSGTRDRRVPERIARARIDLRHAIVLMTIVGRCRAADPYGSAE